MYRKNNFEFVTIWESKNSCTTGRKNMTVTENRGVEDSRRRHHMEERGERCYHYAWEDRYGPRLRQAFTVSHLETALTSAARVGTSASIHDHVRIRGLTLNMYLLTCTYTNTHFYDHAVGVKQADYTEILQEHWMLEGHLKWIMNTIIFPSILEHPVSALSLKQRHSHYCRA